MKRYQKNIKMIATILAFVFAGFFGSQNASAISATDSQLNELAIMQGTAQCYRDYAKSEVKLKDFDGWSKIFNTSGDWTKKSNIWVPTNVGNTDSDSKISCSQVFSGGSGVSGFSNYSTIPNTLDGLGYYFDHAETGDPSAGQVTIKIESIKDSTGSNSTKTDVSGTITVEGTFMRHWCRSWEILCSEYYYWDITSVSGGITATYDGQTMYSLTYGTPGSFYAIEHSDFSEYTYKWDDAALYNAVTGAMGNKSDTKPYPLETMLGTYVGYIKDNLKNAAVQKYSSPEIKITAKNSIPSPTDPSNANSVYVPFVSTDEAGHIMAKNASAGENVPHYDSSLSSAEGKHEKRTFTWKNNYKYALYYRYVQEEIKKYPDMKIGTCSEDKPSEAAYYFKNSEESWCAIDIPTSAQGALTDAVAIVGASQLEGGTFQDVLTWFGDDSSYDGLVKEDYANLDVNDPKPNPNPEPGETEDPDADLEEKCYAEAKSLGWILCPIIFGLQDATGKFYEGVEEPMLMTNGAIVNQLGNTGSGIYEAWSVFRGFANIVFMILFMFVIFSQLTGFGIDNYGIKKMLPKLIITAILVNLSFWICAIAVDISNIAGRSLKVMFEGIGSNISAELGGSSASAIEILGKKALSFIAATGASLVAGVTAFAFSGWAVIIPIFIFFLTVVIAIFFAVVVLGMRQALVVILIVISPLALALMLLPNTEPLYKKWFSTAKSVLMVYPIVGAIIGVGYLTACILINSDPGFFMTLVAGILMVGPYFLVPSLTRKALDMAGGIGTKLGNIGRATSGKVSSGLNNSDVVKNAKADAKAQKNSLGAKLYMRTLGKGVERDIKAGNKVSTRRANSYARNAAMATTNQQSKINARAAQSQYNRLNSEGGFQAAMSAANMAEDATATKNYETMLADGQYRYEDSSGNIVSVDSQSNEQIAAALEYELLRQKGNGYNSNKVRALSNALAAKGKDGRSLMYDTVTRAQANGASNQAIKDFSSNIMNNHAGTMKDKARSLYEFAKNTADVQITDSGAVVPKYARDGNGDVKLDDNNKPILAAGYEMGEDGTVKISNASKFATAGTGSLTAADMTNMDLQQLHRYNANASGKELQTLGQLAQQALTDEHLSKDLSGKTYNELSELASKAGYTPPPRGGSKLEGDSGKLHDNVTQAEQAVNQNRKYTSKDSVDPAVQSSEDQALQIVKSGATDAVPTRQIISGKDGTPISSDHTSSPKGNNNPKPIITPNNRPGDPTKIIKPNGA